MSRFARLRAWAMRLVPAFLSNPERRSQRAMATLEAALAEEEGPTRLERLREALALAERVPDGRADTVVLEASLHLGERMRAAGRPDEAALHFERAVERSFRLPEPAGRHRRAGLLTRLAILDQESGRMARAQERYREALDLGRDASSQQVLGMLTQAAFNLGLLHSESGDETSAVAQWTSALELGLRAGHRGGWDPAAVAAFNLGHHFSRIGDADEARRMFRAVVKVGEPAGSPLGRMACAKASLALAGMAEQEGLLGVSEADREYARAVRFGRESGLPEGALAALQGTLALGERANAEHRPADAIRQFRSALELAARCEAGASFRFSLLARLRFGQALADVGPREEAVTHLRQVFDLGRRTDEPVLQEIAAQAACNLHRTLAVLEQWGVARALADETLAFTRTLTSRTGRALEAAAHYALAFQTLHEGTPDAALVELAEVVRLGRESESDFGVRIALDALLLSGHLHRQGERLEPAVRAFKDALALLRDRGEGGASSEVESMTAMARVQLGHALLGLGRELEARTSYEAALTHGRASGLPSGRAAAANAALNLASLLEDEVDTSRIRGWYEVARALGRSSGTPLGLECAAQAERGLARMDGGDDDEA